MTITNVPKSSSSWTDLPISLANMAVKNATLGYIAGFTVTSGWAFLDAVLHARHPINLTSHQAGMTCAALTALTDLAIYGTSNTSSYILSKLEKKTSMNYKNALIVNLFSICFGVSGSIYTMNAISPDLTSKYLDLPVPLLGLTLAALMSLHTEGEKTPPPSTDTVKNI